MDVTDIAIYYNNNYIYEKNVFIIGSSNSIVDHYVGRNFG